MPIEFKTDIILSLSPLDFLDMVWVYRNEISPDLDSLRGTLDDLGEYSKKDIMHYARAGILNNSLRESFPTRIDFLRFKIISKDFFTLFKNAKDTKIRKPTEDRIFKARNSFADILKDSLLGLTSNLIEGQIQLSLHCK